MSLRARITETAPTTDVAGQSVALHYGDPTAEYGALRQGCAVLDRSYRHRLTMEGAGAIDSLNGLVTNDVKQLAAGQGQYAAVLSPKGKIISDLRIFRRADGSLLIDAPPRSAQGWMDVVKKYINPRIARYSDVSAELADITVAGAESARVLCAALGMDAESLQNLPRYSTVETDWNGERLCVAFTPDLMVRSFDIFVSATAAVAVWDALLAAGATPAGLVAWEIARIESGTPECGLDIDDATLAQEANMDVLHAISYTKGCYTGQETVARVHFRGHVNRHLRGLRFTSTEVPPRLAQIYGDSDKVLGEVRSSAYSPRQGGVAIAMVRREVPVGSSVIVRWEGAECNATVHELPFERDTT